MSDRFGPDQSCTALLWQRALSGCSDGFKENRDIVTRVDARSRSFVAMTSLACSVGGGTSFSAPGDRMAKYLKAFQDNRWHNVGLRWAETGSIKTD